MKKMLIATLLFMLLFGCATATEAPPPAPTQAPTEEPAPAPTATNPPAADFPDPTATSIPPSETPLPADTPVVPTATPLPEGVLFRDDFSGTLLPGWTWINEDRSRWSFVENGWLEIVGDDPAFYMENSYGMVNFLTRDVPGGEFMITAHIQSNPVENFQQAAIYIFENQDNYIALNIGFCGVCRTEGPGFFMETFIDHNPFEDAYMVKRSPNDADVYLRLVNQRGSVTGYYATSPDNWQKLGAFGNYFDFKFVGLGTTNSNTEGVAADIVSRFDFFEIATP